MKEQEENNNQEPSVVAAVATVLLGAGIALVAALTSKLLKRKK